MAHDLGLVGLGMFLMLAWIELIAWLARRKRKRRVNVQPVVIRATVK